MHRSIHYVTHVDGKTGHVDAQATLTLRNDAPSKGEPAYVIGNSNNLPLGTNRTIVSLYSPFALKGATVDGQAVALSTEHEFGRNVWSKFVDVPPGGTVTIAVDSFGQCRPCGRFVPLRLSPSGAAEPRLGGRRRRLHERRG